MTVQSVPTDSILRRHFDQIARSVDLPSPPQDSILLRHYLQLLNARLTSVPSKPATQAVPPPRPAAPPPAPPPAPPVMRQNHSQPQAGQPAPIPQAQAAPKGFFARILAKLFGN